MNKYIFSVLIDYCNSYNTLITLKHINKQFCRLINKLQCSNIFKNIPIPHKYKRYGLSV